MKKNILILGIFLTFLFRAQQVHALQSSWWPIQSVDTMKYSRDLSGQVLENPEKFQSLIDIQVRDIAGAGATHVAIATPYDEKFIPVLKMWVSAARKNNLKVWFRGNFSGWERWFDYTAIDREEHKKLLKTFLSAHADLFEDGDAFSSCPECENGGSGDPRQVGDVSGYRQFLIDEYQIAKDAFFRMGKNVTPNLMSMNGDIARLVMDKETTQSLGGYVVVDHYVGSVDTLAADAREFAKRSGGKVIFGEFGAPIPDIHGDMTEVEQARWIDQALARLSLEKDVVGINYWTGFGGSTKLWNDGGSEREAVAALRRYYQPPAASGRVVDRDGKPLSGVTVKTPWQFTKTTAAGEFVVPLSNKDAELSVFLDGYVAQNVAVSPKGTTGLDIRLEKISYTIWDQIVRAFHRIFG